MNSPNNSHSNKYRPYAIIMMYTRTRSPVISKQFMSYMQHYFYQNFPPLWWFYMSNLDSCKCLVWWPARAGKYVYISQECRISCYRSFLVSTFFPTMWPAVQNTKWMNKCMTSQSVSYIDDGALSVFSSCRCRCGNATRHMINVAGACSQCSYFF